MFAKRHPQGVTAPHAMAIAHHILRFWLEARRRLADRRAPRRRSQRFLAGARFLRAVFSETPRAVAF